MPEFDSKKPLGPIKINGKDTGEKYGLPNSWFSMEY